MQQLFAVARLVLLLIISSAAVAEAQVSVDFDPGGGTYTTNEVTVDVYFCSETAPLTSERFITLNDVDVTNVYFSYVGTGGACNGWGEHWSGTIELQLGSNTLYAYAYSEDDQWGSNTGTFVYSQPVATVTVTNSGAGTLGVGQTTTMTARAFAANGTELFGHTFYWSGTRMHASAQANPQRTSVTATADVAGQGSMTAMTSNVSGTAYVTVVNPTYAVAVSSNRSSSVTLSSGATSTGTTTYTVSNNSSYTNSSPTFTMTATPTGVIGTCSVSPGSYTLAPGGGSVNVSVACPIGATTATSSPTVTFRVATSSPTSFEQSHVTTYNVSPAYAFAVSLPNGNSTTMNAQASSGSAVFRVHNNSVNAGGAATLSFPVSCGNVVSCSSPANVTVSEGSYANVTLNYSISPQGQNGTATLTARRGSTNYGSATLTVNTTPHYAVAVTASNVSLAAGSTSGSITYTVTNNSSNTSAAGVTRTFNVSRSCGTPLLSGCAGAATIALPDRASGTVVTTFNVTASGTFATAALTASNSSPAFSGSASPTVSIPPLYVLDVTSNAPTLNLAARTRSSNSTYYIANRSRNTTATSHNFQLFAACGAMSSGCTIPNPTVVTVNVGGAVTYTVPYNVSITGTSGWTRLIGTHANFGPDTAVQNLTITPYYDAQLTQAFGTAILAPRSTSGSTAFTLRNLSENAGSVEFSLNASCGQVVTGCSAPPPSVTLTYNQTSSVPITYTVGRTGTTGPVTLEATAASGALQRSLSHAVATTPSYSIVVTPASSSQTIAAGTQGTHGIQLENTSWNTTSAITASLTGDTCTGKALADCSIAPARVTLAQGSVSSPLTFRYSAIAPGTDTSVFRAAVESPAQVIVGDGAVAITVSASAALTTILKGLNGTAVIDRGGCVTIAAFDGGAFECGDLRAMHVLPATTTLAKTRAPALLYNSRHATGTALLAANVIYNGASTPDAIRAAVTIGTFPSFTQSFPWNSACAAKSCRLVIATGALPTGVYPLTVTTSAISGTNVLHTSNAATDTIIVVNRSGSHFGSGWWLDGLERLEYVSPTQRLWIGGDGSARIYTSTGSGGAWLAANYDAADTLLQVGSKWRRMLGNGAYVQFNTFGAHDTTRNELGHVTSFTYTAAGSLQAIGLPVPGTTGVPRAYTFAYRDAGSGPVLDSVIAPSATAPRVVRAFIGSSRQVDSIVDPDNHAVRFGYVSGRMATLWSKRGDATWIRYDNAGALKEIEIDMSRSADPNLLMKYRAAETRSAAIATESMLTLDRAYTHFQGPRNVGDSTVFFVNRWGSVDSVINAVGERRLVRRSDPRYPALVTSSAEANGYTQRAYFNNRGLLDSTVQVNPIADGRNAVTRYSWHPTWSRVIRTTGPSGEVRLADYATSVPALLWTQRDTDPARRTTLSYNARWQLEYVQPPGNPANRRQRIDYDEQFGNVMRVTTPIGFITRHYTDALGRDTLVITPTDSATGLSDASVTSTGTTTRTRYDAMGRVDSMHTAGKARAYSAAQSLATRSTYDPDGNLLHLDRFAFPVLPGIGSLRMSWTYDAVGRVLTETAPDLAAENREYDEAGNLVRVITRRGDTLDMEYDRLNRLTRRNVPAREYDVRSNQGVATLSLEPFGQMPYPWYPTDADGGLTIPGDVETFEYGPFGLKHASNADAIVGRAFYPNGALQLDTLIIRTISRTDSSAHRYVTKHSYDLSGRRIAVKHPAQLAAGAIDSVRYIYNALGDLESVIDLMGNTFTFTYDAAGNQVRMQLPGGLVDSMRYDHDGRLIQWRLTNRTGAALPKQYAGSILRNEVLGLDALGRAVSTSDLQINNSMLASYSGLGHLVRREMEQLVTSNLGNSGGIKAVEGFTLDGLGNRSLQSAVDTLIGSNRTQTRLANDTYAYGPAGRVYRLIGANRHDTLSYDGAGNQELALVTWFDLGLPRFNGRVSDRNYAASCNCASYAAGLM